jgi:hypothetical protein
VRRQDIMSELYDNQHEPLDNTRDFLNLATQWYSSLYSPIETQAEDRQRVLSYLPESQKLSSEARASLDAPISRYEINAAIDKLSSDTSPGRDGLSPNLYKTLEDYISPIIWYSFQQSMQEGYLAPHQSDVVIKLIPKPGKDSTLLTNWRPISLLNIDRKVLAHVLNTRLRQHLGQLVLSDQTGFIPKRLMHRNITDVQVLTQSLFSGFLASVDLHKAYDLISFDFIYDCLQCFGFGSYFVSAVRLLLEGRRAQVYINGRLGHVFPIQCGLPQGDPLSPSLFALIVEPLLCMVRARTEGLVTRDLSRRLPTELPVHFKVSAYADDILIGASSVNDLQIGHAVVEEFCQAAGARLNPEKTLIVSLGPLSTSLRSRIAQTGFQQSPLLDLTQEQAYFWYLGVPIGRNDQLPVANIWNDKLAEVKRRMKSIPMFDLPVTVRCWILNTFCFSKITFLDQYMPCSKRHLQELMELGFELIRGRNSRLPVSREVITTPLLQGGFGLIELSVKTTALRAKRVYLLLEGDTFARALLHRQVNMALDSDPLVVWLENRFYRYSIAAYYSDVLVHRSVSRSYVDLPKSMKAAFHAWFQLVTPTSPSVSRRFARSDYPPLSDLVAKPEVEFRLAAFPNGGLLHSQSLNRYWNKPHAGHPQSCWDSSIYLSKANWESL